MRWKRRVGDACLRDVFRQDWERSFRRANLANCVVSIAPSKPVAALVVCGQPFADHFVPV